MATTRQCRRHVWQPAIKLEYFLFKWYGNSMMHSNCYCQMVPNDWVCFSHTSSNCRRLRIHIIFHHFFFLASLFPFSMKLCVRKSFVSHDHSHMYTVSSSFFFLGKWRIRALRNCRLEEQKLFPFDRKQYPWNTSLSFGKENSKHMANVTFSHYVNFAYSWLLSSSSLKSNIHNIRATNTP